MKKFVKWLLKFLTGEGDACAETAAIADGGDCCFVYDELWVYEDNVLMLC